MNKFTFSLILIFLLLLSIIGYLAYTGNEVALFFSGWFSGVLTAAIGWGLSLTQNYIASKSEEKRFMNNVKENMMLTLTNQKTMGYQNMSLVKENRELKKMLPAENKSNDGYEELSWDDAIFEVNE